MPHFGCRTARSALSPFKGRNRPGMVLGVLVMLGQLFASDAFAQSMTRPPDDLFAGADFRHVGPVGNRVSAVTGEPGNPNVYYFGAASGGVFKSEDGGHSWRPIFDDQSASSISALAMAPSDPNVVWAGTGETFLIRPAHAMGDGIYRSTDAGRTWRHMGLDATGRIGRIEPRAAIEAILTMLPRPRSSMRAPKARLARNTPPRLTDITASQSDFCWRSVGTRSWGATCRATASRSP